MMELPPSALLLAGFTLAHAVWSVSDTKPDELLVPLSIVEHDGQRVLRRFEAATQLEAITRGKDAMAKLASSEHAWAFAREGALREPPSSDITHDVISVDFHTPEMSEPAVVVQQFERASDAHGFRLVGPPFISIHGQELSSEDAAPYIAKLTEGVISHSKVALLWHTWK